MPDKDNTGQSRGPSHYNYVEQTGKDGKSYLRRIGAAFEHKDGEGFTHDNFAESHNGKIIMRSAGSRLAEQRNGSAKQQDRDHGRDK